jgi:hypothetical protein
MADLSSRLIWMPRIFETGPTATLPQDTSQGGGYRQNSYHHTIWLYSVHPRAIWTIKNTGMTFQRMMDQQFFYLLAVSSTMDEHQRHLRQVLR